MSHINLEKRLVETFFSNIDAYIKDYHETFDRVSKSKAIYKGAPVPYLHIPKIYNKVDVETFQKAIDGIHRLCQKTIALYLEKPEIRAMYGFDPRLEALIMLPHHYASTVPMGRFDIFYYGEGNFKFCELNADGASAMNEDFELSKILRETALMETLKGEYAFTPNELFHSWVEEVKVIYAEFLEGNQALTAPQALTTPRALTTPHIPTVAILDFIDKGSSIEFEVFRETFESHGFNCVIVDPRNITTRDGHMYAGEVKIDIVYRRLVTKDLMDRYDEVPQFIEGLFAGKTCVVGSIKTQIIHTKRFFEMLYEPELRKYLDEEELAFIDAHVPYTRPLVYGDDFEKYLKNRSDYIIKPIDYYASKGVCAGRDYTDAEWHALLLEKEREGYIIQEYCPVAYVDNIFHHPDGHFSHERFNTVTGLFTYNQKLSGIYVRAGLNAIVSGLHDGFTMATLVSDFL